MKRVIKSNSETIQTGHFTDLFNAISEVIYVDDINSIGSIYAATDPSLIDYSNYTDEELLNQSIEDIHSIQDLYTISRIYNLDKSKLTRAQQLELQKQYHVDPEDPNSVTWRYYITDEDVEKILDMLKEHDWVDGPVRSPDPRKNFARLHHLRITQTDYASILHSLTVAECRVITPYLTVSRNINNLGNNLIVFNVDKEYKLEDGTSIGDFKIYIKIDLTRTDVPGEPIALISFHE